MKISYISPEFIKALQNEDELKIFVDKVSSTNSPYSLEIRDRYINIYYRGGNILKISESNPNDKTYTFEFDVNYGKRKGNKFCDFMLKHQKEITPLNKDAAISYFDDFRIMMDDWLAENPKREREYQHYASLSQNNRNILDVEHAINELNMRLDMIMVDKKGELYLVENKYGNGSLSSRSRNGKGVFKHYQDMLKLVTEKQYWSNIAESMDNVLIAKQKLKLISNDYHIKRDHSGKPIFHILFVFANLTLSQDSQLMNHEIEDISKLDPSITNLYPPTYIRVDAMEYKLNLETAKPLLSFAL